MYIIHVIIIIIIIFLIVLLLLRESPTSNSKCLVNFMRNNTGNNIYYKQKTNANHKRKKRIYWVSINKQTLISYMNTIIIHLLLMLGFLQITWTRVRSGCCHSHSHSVPSCFSDQNLPNTSSGASKVYIPKRGGKWQQTNKQARSHGIIHISAQTDHQQTNGTLNRNAGL